MRKKFLSSLIAAVLSFTLFTSTVFAGSNKLWNNVKIGLDKTGQTVVNRVTGENIKLNDLEVKDITYDGNKNKILNKDSKKITNKKICKVTENNLDKLYKEAYDATIKCLNEKTQKSIKEARKAIEKLPKQLNWAKGTFSVQVDQVQQPIFTKIINYINNSKKSKKQKDINKGKELVKDVIEIQYRSTWSSELDKVEGEKISKVVDGINKISLVNDNTLDLKEVKEEIDDISTVKYNDGVKEWIDSYKAGLDNDVEGLKALTDNYAKSVSEGLSKDEINKISSCKDLDVLVEYLKSIKADKDKAFNAGRLWAAKTFNVASWKVEKQQTLDVQAAIALPSGSIYTPTFVNEKVVIDNNKQSKGFTPLGVLEAIGAKYEVNKEGSYVTSISGIGAKESDGWMYTVNGKEIMESADKCKLKSGDKVLWYYATKSNQWKAPSWEELLKTQNQNERIDKALKNNLKYLTSLSSKDLNEWNSLVLSKCGEKVSEENLNKFIKSIKDKKDKAQDTDYAKAIIALTAAGKDARVVDKELNLVEKLCKKGFIKNNVFSEAYSLIALDCGKYEIKNVTDSVRKDLVKNLITKSKDKKGWGFGNNVDLDTTAIVMTALAPYNDSVEVKECIENAAKTLANMQNKKGLYYSEWTGESSESLSQAIIALTSNKIDPASKQFTKNGNNLISNLLSFANDKGFMHNKGQVENIMSTSQATQALISYRDFVNNKGAFYELKDFSKVDNEKSINIEVKIAIPSKKECILKCESFKVNNEKQNITVLDSLKNVTDKYIIENSTYGLFVKSILGIENKNSDGWCFRVNDVQSSVGASKVNLKDGDKVLWYYATEENQWKAPKWDEVK